MRNAACSTATGRVPASLRPAVHARTQQRREHDGLVMHLVARPEDERYAPARRERGDPSQHIASLTQLPFVARLELGPLFWIVTEPSPPRP
jgi:hypothetical protein